MWFILLLFIGALVVFTFLIPAMLTIFIPVYYISQWRRHYVETIVAYWFKFATYVTINVCGTHIFVYSADRKILSDKGSLIISNHRTRVDWMYVGWCYSSLINSATSLKIILKDALRSVPVFGWTMQLLLFIFLSRNRDHDIPHIAKVFSYLHSLGSQPSVLIFPEGTDLSESNIVKSNEFAKANNYPELHQVLYPKSLGLLTCIDSIRGKGFALHDITIAYKDSVNGRRASEMGLLKGEYPKEVHLIVDRYEVDSLPTDKKQFDEWLRQVFQKKEKLLQEWYNHESVTSNVSVVAGVVPQSWPPLLESSHTNNDVKWSACLVVCVACMLIVCLLYLPLMKWIVLGFIIFAVCATSVGGMDKIELAWHTSPAAKEKRL